MGTLPLGFRCLQLSCKAKGGLRSKNVILKPDHELGRVMGRGGTSGISPRWAGCSQQTEEALGFSANLSCSLILLRTLWCTRWGRVLEEFHIRHSIHQPTQVPLPHSWWQALGKNKTKPHKNNQKKQKQGRFWGLFIALFCSAFYCVFWLQPHTHTQRPWGSAVLTLLDPFLWGWTPTRSWTFLLGIGN